MNLLLPTLLATSIVLCGCAASVTRSAPTPAQTIETAAEMQPVRVPVESRKRLVLNVSGAKICTDSKDWADFRKEWRDIFEQQATTAGLKFDWQEGEARAIGEPGVLVSVHVNDYRVVGIGSRIMFGIMTGNAFVDATLKFTDLNAGPLYGEQVFNTSSSAGHGVFAAVTTKQLYAIADEVIASVQGR